jgi:glycosyltransferase involved in cell wall biosynthesis
MACSPRFPLLAAGQFLQCRGVAVTNSPYAKPIQCETRPMNRQVPRQVFIPAARMTAADQAARVAIVHDWCPDFRGGERVLERLCQVVSDPAVFTLFDFLSDDIKQRHFPGVSFHVSPVNNWPLIRRYYRHLFFACPFLIEQFDVTGYDAVISSSAAFARGVLTRPDQPHLCYVHSPARYAWDEQFSYLAQARLGFGLKGLLFRYMLHRLRNWDVRTAHGPDLMVANSRYVRGRIRRIYGRDAQVIHPPVDTDDLPFQEAKDDYYVSASFLAPYKRTDLVIEAFNRMPDRQLLVVGEGQQSARLRELAGRNVTFSGYLPRTDYVEAIANAKAMVFAGCEDFGIALAEAQACGTPLIAFGRGGACDIVRALGAGDAPTGVLFTDQSVAALQGAIETFERHSDAISPAACQLNASRFSVARFDREISAAFSAVRAMHADRIA